MSDPPPRLLDRAGIENAFRRLVELLGLRNAEDVLACVHEVFPEEDPPERLRLLLEDLFSAQEK